MSDRAGSTAHNLEFKCRLRNRAAVEAALTALGATFVRALSQRDTYLHSAVGVRLKVREQDGAAELIEYRRDESGADRVSRYTLTPLVDPARDLAALVAEHGVRGVVRKRRDLWMVGITRVHLDQVEGSGSFLEFEVVEPSSLAAGQVMLRELMDALGLDASEGMRVSYIDLLEASDGGSRGMA